MKQKLTQVSFALCLLVPLFLLAVPSWGQQVTAAITGTVLDPSSAPIPNAKVTATDQARGTVWTTLTNQDGVYNLPRLPVGTYDVKVEAQGFQTSTLPPVTLQLNQTARVDFKMQIGQVSETVEVTGAAPALQTSDAQLGTVINSVTNESLPLATRNYVQLTLLAPGTTHPDPSSMTSGQTTGVSGRPYVNGNREQANNFLLDGIDNNQVSDNLVGYTPSVDAIQEFNMITNNASAEFGNFQGGIISTYIKSGSNEFHGDLFEFFRNDKLNANDWAANWSGGQRQLLRWNMFGGTIGGPIKKDKLFFFADYQGQRFNFPATTGTTSVFTAAERQGDFSQLLREKGIQLYNPFNVINGNRQPFPNNQIPVTLIDPVAKALFANPTLYPLPVNGKLQNNLFIENQSQVHGDQGDVKIDANLTDKDHVFGRVSQSRQDNPSVNSFPLFFPGFFEAPSKSAVGNWTRTFSPTVVNEVRLGVNYVLVHNGDLDKGLGNVAQELGIQNGNERGPGLMALNISGGAIGGFGSANIGTQQMFANTVIQAGDTLILTKGRHVVHTGFQYFRQRINTFYAGNFGRTGNIDFTGKFTAGPSANESAGGGAGAGEADFFLGLPSSLERGVNTGPWGQRANVIAGYVQDDWRVTNGLSVNVGLRYENHTPWYEVHDRQANFAPFSGAIQLAGQSGYYSNKRALYNDYNLGYDFQPRFGFAWTPAMFGGKTVLRGAYTISSYLEGTGTNLRLPLNPPFNEEFQTRYDNVNITLPPTRTDQGLTVLSSPTDPFAGATIRLWDPNVKPAMAQQWNLSVQTQFASNTTLQVGYVGQHGTHLMVPMPYFQRRLLPDGSTAPSPYLSGNPALANIGQISGTESNGNMKYNALQATLQRRFSGGLQFQVAYTYSKCMTNSSGYYGSWGGQAIPTSPYFQNLYDSRAEWGPCYYDVAHTLTNYAVYDIPFGRNRKFGKSLNPVINAVAGDWNVTGILTLHTGYPLTISGGDESGTNSRGSRANCIAAPHVFGTRNDPAGGFLWFDPNSYAPADPHTFGSCGVGTVRGPGLRTLDFSVMKEFPITEKRRLEFRSEFINFTNTPILNAPSSGLGADLGRLTSSQGPRNIQFALKFYY